MKRLHCHLGVLCEEFQEGKTIFRCWQFDRPIPISSLREAFASNLRNRRDVTLPKNVCFVLLCLFSFVVTWRDTLYMP